MTNTIAISALILGLFGFGILCGYGWGRATEAETQINARRNRQDAEATVFSDPRAIQAFADLRHGLQDLRRTVDLNAHHTLGALDRLEAAEERRADLTQTPQ